MPEPLRRLTHALTAVAVLVVLVAGVGSCAPAEDEFVTRSGTSLWVDGEEFRFVGFNLYDAAASDLYSCSPTTRLDDAALDAAMQSVRDAGGTVVRFWAFQPYTAGGTDFSGVDRVLDAAREHGLRVMPVLENGQGDCSTGERGVPLRRLGDGRWYSEGYRDPLGTAEISFRDYSARVARHYRDDPTIVAWSLINEAETPERSADGRSALVAFARDMSAVVHRADPQHLVTLGTQGNGALGASGRDFGDIYALDGMDLTEVHDWGHFGSDTEAMPGAGADGVLPEVSACTGVEEKIACSFAIARDLGKPIVVGEAGIDPADVGGLEARAGLFDAKLTAAFDAGAVGYLVWQLNTADTDGYGVIAGGSDPLFDVLRRHGRRFTSL